VHAAQVKILTARGTRPQFVTHDILSSQFKEAFK